MAINLAKNIAGAGVLSLSAGIASFSGAKAAVLPATLLLLFLGAVSAYSFSLLARVVEDNGTDTIRETWSKLFGERWAIIPDATIIFECMCAATSFAIIIGETFSSVATLCGARAALAAPNAWIVLLSLFVLLPLCLLRDLGSLAFGSILGTSGTVFTAGFMVLRALDGTYAPGGRFFTSLAAASQPRFGGPTKPLNVCILVSLLATSFLAHFNAPTMYNQLAAPEDGSPKLRRFNRVVAGGFGLASLLGALIMSAGFVTFGCASNGLVLNNYAVADRFALTARLGIGLSIIFSYPLNFVGLREGALALIGKQKQAARRSWHAASTVLLLGVMNGLALVVKDLGALAAFSGALAGSAIIYIFPAAMFLKSAALQRAKGTDATSGAPRYQTREVVANWLMAGLGVLLAIVGGTVSAKAL